MRGVQRRGCICDAPVVIGSRNGCCPKKKSVFCGAPVVIGSLEEEGMSKVCSAPVEICSGNVLLLQWCCAPSGGRSPSEDAEEENL